MKLIGTIIKAVLIAYLVIFAVNNSAPVEFSLFFGTPVYKLPMFLFTIIVAFGGFLIGAFLMTMDKISLNSQLKKTNKALQESQNEILKLKNVALAPSDQTQSNLKMNDNTAQNADIKDILR